MNEERHMNFSCIGELDEGIADIFRLERPGNSFIVAKPTAKKPNVGLISPNHHLHYHTEPRTVADSRKPIFCLRFNTSVTQHLHTTIGGGGGMMFRQWLESLVTQKTTLSLSLEESNCVFSLDCQTRHDPGPLISFVYRIRVS